MMGNRTRVIGAVAVMLLVGMSAQAGEIHDAINAVDVARVSALLAADSSLVHSADERGRTLLHAAVLSGNPELTALVIEKGADINARDNAGWTPLLMVANRGDWALVEMLLDSGADVHPVLQPYGMTAADFAFATECRLGSADILPLFISHGAEFDPNLVSLMGNMPRIFLTIVFGNTEMLEYLITLGADVNVVRERDGRTPVGEASFRGRPEIIRSLLAHGADFTTPDVDGNPPLRFAVEGGNLDIVRILFEKGAGTDFVDRRTGNTFLHLAAIKGYCDVAEILAAKGCDVNAVDKDGTTPIQCAARYGNKQIVDLLSKHGARLPKDSEINFGKSSYLSGGVQPNSAVAWYLNNRGWAVKTPSNLLVFDYEAFGQTPPTEPSLANGFMDLREIRDENMYAIYTCFHAEVGELEYLHTLEDSLAKATYINNRDDPWRGCKNTVYLGPDETKDFGDVQVYAIRPTSEDFMPTLAYLITTDGLSIFYAGFVTDSLGIYKRSIESLKQYTGQIDLAFLPIPEPGGEAASDLRAFLETWNPRAICLLDPNHRVDLFPALAEQIKQWGFKTEVFCAENPGDRFVYSVSSIQ